MHGRFDGVITRIADRCRRQTAIHTGVVGIRGVLQLVVGQLHAVDAGTIGHGAVHAERHVFVETIVDHSAHLAVVVR